MVNAYISAVLNVFGAERQLHCVKCFSRFSRTRDCVYISTSTQIFAIRYAQLIEQYHLCSRTDGVLWSICART